MANTRYVSTVQDTPDKKYIFAVLHNSTTSGSSCQVKLINKHVKRETILHLRMNIYMMAS